ncbi:uncharacterized protein LOC117787125 [Drosophila innubila]|uniref:uncharacterized protein LOC117787125 n=1 Tax=Drosophila innubila TaxID=198719 RepID=UPI00148CBFEA|nr:uncharacterized protein LOC117787125 [Drosophila innubila]
MYSAKQLSLLVLVLAQLLGAIHCAIYDNTDNWVLADKTKTFPENAVLGGFDSNGYDNFVARVVSGNNILPARVVSETGGASYNTDATAYTANSYELLVSNATLSYQWVRSYDGYREKNAVAVGTNSSNDLIYICRARVDNGQYIGSLYLAKRKCFIKIGTLALRQLEKYEVLVRESKSAPWSPFEA